MNKLLFAVAASSALSSPALADVKSTSDSGFNVVHITEVAVGPDVVWKRLIAPKDWWNKAHSWSGSSEGFYIDAQAGGCFCELFKEKGADGKPKTTGSVEHMRVIFAQPDKVLRMQGALGPLQSEAVLGTLTVALAATKDGKGTKLSFSYVVGGYMRYKVAEIAPAVDKVLGEQFKALIAPFAPVPSNAPALDGFSLDIETLEDPLPVVEDGPVAEKPKAPVMEPDTSADSTAESGRH
ncbi:MAG: hypothetical protein WBO17_12835 [Sphingorhabdus sp.]